MIALSFFSGFAPEAYRLAAEFRRRGKIVVAGGPHATFSPDEVLRHCDSVVMGEAESAWPRLLDDAEAGRLRPRYEGEPSPMRGLPTPRYDLLPKRFFVTRVVQATRGCPFTCSFCTVPTLNPGFRMRPVEDVLRDVRYDDFAFWWQRKVVWFWDDNLTIRREYVRELLARMAPLKRWWLTQASMDIAKDAPLLDLMRESGCIGIFFGIESFGEDSLEDARKRQNRVAEYRERIEALHQRGICVMSGFIAGFDGDTPDSHTGHGPTALRDRRRRPVPEHSDPLPRDRASPEVRGRGQDPGRPRLGVLQRLQRRIRAGADESRRTARRAQGPVVRGVFGEVLAQASLPRDVSAAPRRLPHVRDDEPVLLPEGASRECSRLFRRATTVRRVPRPASRTRTHLSFVVRGGRRTFERSNDER